MGFRAGISMECVNSGDFSNFLNPICLVVSEKTCWRSLGMGIDCFIMKFIFLNRDFKGEFNGDLG